MFLSVPLIPYHSSLSSSHLVQLAQAVSLGASPQLEQVHRQLGELQRAHTELQERLAAQKGKADGAKSAAAHGDGLAVASAPAVVDFGCFRRRPSLAQVHPA